MEAKNIDNQVDRQTGFVKAVAELLCNHVALLAVELEEARQFYWRNLILLAICITSGLLFFVLFFTLIITVFWSTDYRMVAILCVLGVSFLTVLISGFFLMRLRKKTVLFSATKAELIKNQAIFYDE